MNKKYIRILAEMAIVFSAAGMMTGCINKRVKDVSSSQANIIIMTDEETTADDATTEEIIEDSNSNIKSMISSLEESSLKDSSVTSSGSSSLAESSSVIEICNSENMQNETQIAPPIETAPVTYANEYSNNDVFEYTEPVAITEEISVDEPVVEYTDAAYAPSDLYTQGRLYYGDYQYTWYSERVLPGYGLAIDGRHTDKDGFVCDGEGYICVASGSLDKGTVIDTPFGEGKVYDCGCPGNVIDVYVNW